MKGLLSTGPTPSSFQMERLQSAGLLLALLSVVGGKMVGRERRNIGFTYRYIDSLPHVCKTKDILVLNLLRSVTRVTE